MADVCEVFALSFVKKNHLDHGLNGLALSTRGPPILSLKAKVNSN